MPETIEKETVAAPAEAVAFRKAVKDVVADFSRSISPRQMVRALSHIVGELAILAGPKAYANNPAAMCVEISSNIAEGMRHM